MKNLKQKLAGGLAVLMAFLLAPTLAFAAVDSCEDYDECDGSHSVYDAAHPVSLSIHLYKNATGNGTAAGTGLETDTTGWDAIANVEFTITQTHDANGNPVSDPGAFTYTGRTNANGLLEVTGLPQGTYKVAETIPANADPDYEFAEFTVELPMTNPVSRNEWIYDVHVYPKNQMTDETLTVTKTLESTERSVANGDEVDWQIQTTIPAGISEARYFVITDPLVGNLNFVSINNVSYYNGTADVPLVAGTDYEIQYISDFNAANPAADGTPTTAPGGTVVVRLTASGFAKLAAAQGLASGDEPLLTVDITTKVVLDEDDFGRITNTANVYYKNGQDEEEEGGPDEEEKPDVVTSAIRIDKVDPDDDPLGGASFVLRRLNGSDYEYYYYDAVSGETKWVTPDDTYSNVTVKTTNNTNGMASFVGLPDGDYELVEIAAPTDPSGQQYNLLKEAVPVNINSSDDEYAGSYLYEKKIVNNLGFELPSTGGNGTLLFTVLGLGLMTLAAITFVLLRKRNNSR